MGINEKAYSEKRDFIRMKIAAPLNATLALAGSSIEGLCKDLSGGGMQVETSQALDLGTELEVEVSSGYGHNPSLCAKAKVVRCQSGDNSSYLLGLEITEMLS